MSGQRDVYRDTLRLAKAGARVIHMASFEWERVQGLLAGVARDLKLGYHIWSYSRGLGQWVDGRIERAEPTDPIDVLRWMNERTEPTLLLLEDFHPYLSPHNHQAVRWVRELCRMPPTPARLVVLATPQPTIPDDLQKEVPTIELPLPDRADLSEVRGRVAESLGIPFDQHADEVLDAARGLTVMEAQLAFGQAAVELRGLDAAAVPLVAREKERIIRQSQILEYYEPDTSLADVGGLDGLKEWLSRRGRAFGAGAREFGLDSPKGVLLLGVQGCGKSLIAKSIASEWRFPLLRFDLGKAFGGIVGQSEGNMRTALHVAQALAPCVLWIDEIEKGMSGLGSSNQSDGGTAARVVGTFLTWMQEKRDAVFVVATANRIDQLPPELLRKGRFDEIFFVDLPTRAARRDILSIHLRRKRREPATFDLEKLAAESLGFSGAELEEAVHEGLFDAYSAAKELTDEHILRAIKGTYPLSRTMREEIDGLRRWAEVRARPATRAPAEPLPEPDRPEPRLRQEVARNPFVPTAKE